MNVLWITLFFITAAYTATPGYIPPPPPIDTKSILKPTILPKEGPNKKGDIKEALKNGTLLERYYLDGYPDFFTERNKKTSVPIVNLKGNDAALIIYSLMRFIRNSIRQIDGRLHWIFLKIS